MAYSDRVEPIIREIEQWAFNKYGYTPSEFRKACCEGKTIVHEYYIETGYFDDDELRKMGYSPKTS